MTMLFSQGEGGWEASNFSQAHPVCHHRMDPVPLLDGTVLYASGHHSKREDDELRPDFGLYLDAVWHPDCMAFYMHWQDFGLPTLPLDKFIEGLELVLDYARDWAVEVGCIGGHGRTGTALCCMAVITGDTAETAKERIKAMYCDRVMETAEQVWLVDAVYAHINNLPIPEKPPEPKWKSSYSGGTKNWKEEGNGEKGENKGKTAKVNTDSSGQEYCSLCQCDIPTPETKECIWCEAKVKGRK
jgi:hypothetical protein